MATTVSLLAAVETALENLLAAIDSDAVQSYSFRGRTYRRADFPKLLDSLIAARDKLKRQAARENSSPVRVVKLGFANSVKR